MGGSSGGGGSTRTVTETRIPQELVPFVRAQSQIGLGALRRQEAQLAGAGADELVAPLDPLQIQGQQLAQDAVSEGGIIPQITQDLQNTAAGNFLFGNEGFDEAVQASIRAAQPAILSTFGRAGGTPGGLAATAIQQVASDAFSRQFAAERQRQQAAQLALPQLSLLPSDILSSIGAENRALAQQELLAPITANEAVLSAAGGGVPLASLLGQSSATSGPGRSSLAGGLTGALGGGALGLGLGAATASPAAAAAGGIGALGGPLGIGLGLGGALLGGLGGGLL